MITIKTYKDLTKFIIKFEQDYFDLLIIQSKGGLGKTYNTNKILDQKVLKINSHMTPFGLYEEAYKNKNKKIWMDDVENLFSNEKMIGICKQLCETIPTKEICYLTSWNIENTRDIPKKFLTSSKVLMTINSVQRIKNSGVGALLDRGLHVVFEPTIIEIAKYIQNNIDKVDEDIISTLMTMNYFSIRDYVKCYQLKSAGFEDWKEIYFNKTGNLSGDDSCKINNYSYNDIDLTRVKCCLCNSNNIIKNGTRPRINNNKQSYKCKDCGYRFVIDDYSNKVKIDDKIMSIIINLKSKGMSLRRIRDYILRKEGINIDHSSVYRAYMKGNFDMGLLNTQKKQDI